MNRSAFLAPFFLLLLVASCSGGGSTGCGCGPTPPNLPTGPGTFTVAPIEVARITDLEPLGAMNPSPHTIPTDHVYFYYAWCPTCPPIPPPLPVLPVYAPGSGQVVWILASAGQPDQKVQVQMTADFSYYLDHIVLDSGITVGITVTAGQRMGQTGSGSSAVDLGVVYQAVTLSGFVNPARYGTSVHTDSPFKYFAESLKSQLYGRVRRTGTDKDGKIDYDVRGRLVGTWFHESVAVADSMGPTAWPKQLAFCPDANSPSETRISIGGTVSPSGFWKPGSGDPDPAQVSVANGKVAYHLKYIYRETTA